MMMVTSAERSHWETDIELDDWQSAVLRKVTILRWKICTIDAASPSAEPVSMRRRIFFLDKSRNHSILKSKISDISIPVRAS